MGQGVALVDGHGVGDAVAGVHHDASGAARGVQGQDGLDGHVHGRNVEGLEHDLCHAFSVGLWVQGSFREQDWVLLRGNTQLVVESVVPDLLHVIPVRHDSMLDGVLQRQYSPLRLRLITHIAVFLIHADHDARHLGAADDGREDGTRGVVTRKTTLHHSAAIVADDRRNLVVSHVGRRIEVVVGGSESDAEVSRSRAMGV
mmetsp:Transcript_94551/g.197513  ORF Transcript_94551/g.197513 Transcript_94551/m.197513 type:complete len:201 (+) Transcript_94551:785-1387(+)